MKLKIVSTLLFLLCIATQPVISQKTWTGGNGTFAWFDANNWSPIGVPTVNDVVIIDDSIAYIEINPFSDLDTAFAKALRIDAVDKIAVHGGKVFSIKTQGSENISLHIKHGVFSTCGDVFIEGAIVDGIKLEGNSTLGVETDASLHILDFANNVNGKGINILPGSLLGNNGHITIRGGGSTGKDGIVNNGEVLNTGLLEIDNLQGNNNFFGIENYHWLSNTGVIKIDSIANSAGIQTSSVLAIIRNHGTIETTGILNQTRPGVNIVNGATLRGSGTITSHLVNISQQGATIQPDFGSSSLTINGDLFIGIDANWNLSIAGIDGPNSFSGHAQLILNGDLTFEDNAITGPTLHVNIENSFVPNELDNFSFIEFLGIKDGDFASFIDQPASQSDWGVFEMPGELVYRKACAAAPNSFATCSGPSCPLFTGTISGDGSIAMNGSFEVQSGEQYDIQFPETELNGGFTVELGTVLNVTAASCSF